MNKLEKDIEEYKNMTEEEKEKNTTSLDELLKEIEDEVKKDKKRGIIGYRIGVMHIF